MQKYSVLLHSPAQDLQALETEAQFAAVRFERLGFQAFATNLEYKLILLRGVYSIFASSANCSRIIPLGPFEPKLG